MSRVYDVLSEFGEQSQVGTDQIETRPHAIMAVWRYRYPVTFSRAAGASFSTNPDDSAALRSDAPLLVVEDLQQVTITHTKSNHVSQLGGTLLPGANYLTEIFPGDWVMVWVVNDLERANDLLKRLRSNKACNHFYDGLKFMGRMTAVRKRIVQNPQGTRVSRYVFNAAGFQELDAQLYYEPYLASHNTGIATDWLRKTGIDINRLINSGDGDPSRGGISTGNAVGLFLDAFYGRGVPKNEGFRNPDPRLNSTAGMDNPNSFVIPRPIGQMLGVSTGSKPNNKMGWNDICEVVWGVQKYQLQVNVGNVVNSVSSQLDAFSSELRLGSLFSPDGMRSGDLNIRRHRLPNELLGTFLPSPPQFNGQRTVWSILQQFLNPTINEMYTCLRANAEGNIFPTLIVRQLPFSSGILDDTYRPRPVIVQNVRDQSIDSIVNKHLGRKDKKGTQQKASQVSAETEGNQERRLNLTRFGELPRWRLHPILVTTLDVGRSDALRFNFVHVYGETGLQSQNRTRELVRDPPIIDELDVARGGLRPYMTTVHCAPADAVNRKAGDWMYILSDILMGQHLTLTGTVETVGIQAPICPGDNLELDDHLFHIESVTHTFNMTEGGSKTFRTSMALTHGLKADQLTGTDFALFSGTTSADFRKQDPAISRDYRLNSEEPQTPPDEPVRVEAGEPVVLGPTSRGNKK